MDDFDFSSRLLPVTAYMTRRANVLRPVVFISDGTRKYVALMENVMSIVSSSTYKFKIPLGEWTISVSVTNWDTSPHSFTTNWKTLKKITLHPNETAEVMTHKVDDYHKVFGIQLQDYEDRDILVKIIFSYDFSESFKFQEDQSDDLREYWKEKIRRARISEAIQEIYKDQSRYIYTIGPAEKKKNKYPEKYDVLEAEVHLPETRKTPTEKKKLYNSEEDEIYEVFIKRPMGEENSKDDQDDKNDDSPSPRRRPTEYPSWRAELARRNMPNKDDSRPTKVSNPDDEDAPRPRTRPTEFASWRAELARRNMPTNVSNPDDEDAVQLARRNISTEVSKTDDKDDRPRPRLTWKEYVESKKRLKPEQEDVSANATEKDKGKSSIKDEQKPFTKKPTGLFKFGSVDSTNTHCDIIHEDKEYDDGNEEAYLSSMRRLLISV